MLKGVVPTLYNFPTKQSKICANRRPILLEIFIGRNLLNYKKCIADYIEGLFIVR